MRFYLHIDKTSFNKKPVGGEIGGIRSRLDEKHSQTSLQEIEFAELVELIRTGHTIQPCNVYSERKQLTNADGSLKFKKGGSPERGTTYTYKGQQIFFLDIDNETEDVFDRERIGTVLSENGLCAAIVYHTFSSTQEHEKFRVCILLDAPVADETERNKIIHTLMKLFGQAIDKSCTDKPRMFFGSPNDIIWEDESCTCSKETILKLYDDLCKEEQPEPLPEMPLNLSPVPSTSTQRTGLDKSISPDFDPDVLLDMIDPNDLEYNPDAEIGWIAVSTSYKYYSTGTQSFEHWMQWNQKFHHNNEEANRRTWNGLKGGCSDGTLKEAAKRFNPSEFFHYSESVNVKSRELNERKAQRGKNFSGNQTAGKNQPPKKKKYHAIRLSEVQPERQEFLWYPYIPIGEITVMFAAGGTGKSFATVGIGADITAGRTLPRNGMEATTARPENVLYISAEDNESIILNRMKEAGGNPNNCIVLKTPKNIKELDDESFLLPQNKHDSENIQAFSDLLEEYHPKLVIIDPWSVYIGDDKNMNRANDVRGITSVLTVLAKQFHCAILIVAHVNKKAQADNANDAVSGSTALIDAARSAIAVRSFGADSDRRVMVQTKSNYERKEKSVVYRIINQGDGVTARFEWAGFSDLTADDLTNSARTGKKLSDIANEKEDEEENIQAIVEVITSLSEPNKKIPISYNRFRTEIIDFCGEDFLGSQPKKYLNKALTDLRSRGIGIEIPAGVVKGLAKDGTREENSRGFYICRLTDGSLMADAMPK